MNRDKWFLIGTFLIVLVIFGAATLVFAASDIVTIDVNITESSNIIVLPETLNWTGVGVGTQGGLEYLNIKNVGSLNVSQIYSYVDTLITEAVRPYGSGDPQDYSAGGVLTLKNETDSNYYFAGKIEWNWTQDIPNNNWAAVTNPVAWGFFRNTSYEYVWVLGNGTSYGCNDTDAEFAIEDDVDLGTTDTRTPEAGSGTRNAGDANYSYFSVDRGGSPLNNYCVAASADCTKIFIYNFDQRTNFANCGNSDYIQNDPLTPGYSIILSVIPYIPSGYPSGYLNTTVLTVVAA